MNLVCFSFHSVPSLQVGVDGVEVLPSCLLVDLVRCQVRDEMSPDLISDDLLKPMMSVILACVIFDIISRHEPPGSFFNVLKL